MRNEALVNRENVTRVSIRPLSKAVNNFFVKVDAVYAVNFGRFEFYKNAIASIVFIG